MSDIRERGATWMSQTAADLMQTGMVTVPLEATAQEIECVLVENKVSGVPVRDASDKIVGLVSWRDVMEYFADNSEQDRRNPHAFYRFIDDESLELGNEIELPLGETITAREVMTTDLLTAKSTLTIPEVAALMTEHRVHRLLITDPREDIVGILSTMDILKSLAG